MSVAATTSPDARFESGRRGSDIRSDTFVAFVPGDGGLEIELRSRVDPYYGKAIRAQVAGLAAQFGVARGRIEIEDAGAVPFVLAARLESALRSSGLAARMENGPRGSGSARAKPLPAPEWAFPGVPPASARHRLRRSRLYLPGGEPKYMLNAGLHGADALILDLEDSVHPREKDSARILVRNALLALDFGGAERMVRINQLPLGLTDLEEVVPALPDLILVPKVESAEQIAEVDRAIARIEREAGIERDLYLMPILESALGIENAFAVAQASPRIVALTLGLEDYTADLGVVKTTAGDESLYARTRVVNAAKAAGLQAIDSVFGDVEDLAGLRAWAERSRGLGFEGMGCVHPRQIPVIHEGFAPSAAEIEKALRIVAAFRDAEARGAGVVSLGSKMIDLPVVHRALRLVDQARAMGLVEEEA